MSSLLADIALDFEALANDPIEMGIHYGKSVLQILSDKVAAPKLFLDEMVAAKPAVIYKETKQPAPKFQTSTTTRFNLDRRSFRRDFESLSTRDYSQRRELVGSL